MIPRKIYQTHKSIDFVLSHSKLSGYYNSWNVENYEHIFYDDLQADEFMKEHFTDIYDLYHNLPLPIMKADLWRYCIIYKNGGIYADIDTMFKGNDLDSLFQMDKELILAKEFPHDCNFCQWFFAAPKGSPVLKCVIENVVDKIKNTSDFKYEHMVHATTGPGIFDQSINEYLNRISDSSAIYVHDSADMMHHHIYHDYSGQWQGGWVDDVNKFTGITHVRITKDREGNYSRKLDVASSGIFKGRI